MNGNTKVNQKDSLDFTATSDFKFKVVIIQKYIYDAKFSSNIFIDRRTGCGKTYFTQKLAINNFFGQLKNFRWVSSIELKGIDVEFLYPKGLEKFNDLLEDFKALSNTVKVKDTYSFNEEDIVNSGFGEKSKRD